MEVTSVTQAFPGVYKVTPAGEPAFFLRDCYLTLNDSRLLLSRMTGRLDVTEELAGDEVAADMRVAASTYRAECAAMAYLARAEQCRAALTQKLLRKGHDKAAVAQSLAYLEGQGYLDDLRYAGAWLRNRAIDHAEGRSRLAAELAARGIDRETAGRALDDFFDGQDMDALCQKAAQKLRRKKVPPQKWYAALLRLGFTPAHIRPVLAAMQQGQTENP